MVASARAAVHNKMIRLQSEVWREHVDAKINAGEADVLGLEPNAPRGQTKKGREAAKLRARLKAFRPQNPQRCCQAL